MPKIEDNKKEAGITKPISKKREKMKWDLFICHASEDKEEIVRDLAHALSAKGLQVWYDEFSLKLGDSLRRKIDEGLRDSRYGVVILSPNFFKKEWPQKELDGLVALEADGTKKILPIWHKVGRDDVAKYSPMLAGKLAVSTSRGLDIVVESILQLFSENTLQEKTGDKKSKDSTSRPLATKGEGKGKVVEDPIFQLLLFGVIMSLLGSILAPYAMILLPITVIILIVYIILRYRDRLKSLF